MVDFLDNSPTQSALDLLGPATATLEDGDIYPLYLEEDEGGAVVAVGEDTPEWHSEQQRVANTLYGEKQVRVPPRRDAGRNLIHGACIFFHLSLSSPSLSKVS